MQTPTARGLLTSALLTPLGIIAAVTLWRLLTAWGMPVIQDEAYYYDWSHALAWGYFDHPPGVALLGLGGLLYPGSALAARLGALLIGTLTLFALWACTAPRGCGISHCYRCRCCCGGHLSGARLGHPDDTRYVAGAVLGDWAARGAGGADRIDRRRWLRPAWRRGSACSANTPC
jgi:hypothetical protein